MWTAFDYMYRDAGNFKALGTVLVEDLLNEADRHSVVACLSSGEFFIAEQVGLPPLYEQLHRWSGGPTQSDHCWHEFVAFRDLSELPAGASNAMPAAEFVARFAAVTDWDGELSPHFRLADSLRALRR
ncbi:hypothetical protein [Sphingomonas segetis]|jgi:hypothetical protein|uniref:hypothetical protein n=1 Tax=Sphingomonas segetis TaxID=1104779 RepID=UPI0012D2BDD1|nr:hypothetical protein [Sphingomonas segetis]